MSEVFRPQPFTAGTKRETGRKRHRTATPVNVKGHSQNAILYDVIDALTPPKPAEKGGGLIVRLTSSPCKKYRTTETNTKEQNVNGARSEGSQEAGITKDVSQTQSEADSPRVELLKPKT